MENWDYIVVGAGSAGAVLAERLSAVPANNVLLIEAGPEDRHFLFRIPKGFGKLLGRPEFSWYFPVAGNASNNNREAVWIRGKALGGSSSVNGMVYTRGQPEDYDGWAAEGLTGWGWKEMKRCFCAMEDHNLGADESRGAGGPLKVTAHSEPDPVCDAFIAAGTALGLQKRNDINRESQEGIAYVTRTIAGGVRMSSARAFLQPHRNRSNLTIRTGIEIDRVRFEGKRAVAVEGRDAGGKAVIFHAKGEIVLSAGAIQSPLILQRSGIGPAPLLQRLGIEVLQDSPDVGQNMREHYMLMLNYQLKDWRLSYNRSFAGWRLALHMLRYLTSRTGPMANGSQDVIAFIRSDPSLNRPDAEILGAAWSVDAMGAMEKQPAMHLFSYPLRPESTGSVELTTATPGAPPLIQPRYLTAEADRRSTINGFRFMRRLMATHPMADLVVAETQPGPVVQTDDEILDAYRRMGQAGYHAAGTCRMGGDSDTRSVLDKRLRVRGVQGLRVCDISVMPSLISGNTNGPAMAMGWRLSEMMHEAAV